jgi:IS1 family transposase
LTIVDRETRCVLGWKIVWERTIDSLQEVVDEAPKAKYYYSDGFDRYALLWYHQGRYEVSVGKTDTYSVEGDNAEFRHYLARLARSSRCFSRCPYALYCAIRLFVYCFNSRQLHKQRYPRYPSHLIDFIGPSN